MRRLNNAKLSRRNALVKRLQAVEALGQAKVIAVDKTGTLTHWPPADSTIYRWLSLPRRPEVAGRTAVSQVCGQPESSRGVRD